MKAHEAFLPWEEMQGALLELNAALQANDVPALREFLAKIVHGYVPSNDVVDWVYLKNNE
jgi:hypothetical protein